MSLSPQHNSGNNSRLHFNESKYDDDDNNNINNINYEKDKKDKKENNKIELKEILKDDSKIENDKKDDDNKNNKDNEVIKIENEVIKKEIVKTKNNFVKSIDDNYKPRGIKNLGNTCYINSVIQCLFYCEDFYEYMMGYLNKYKKDNNIVISLGKVLSMLNDKSQLPIDIEEFKNVIGDKRNEFKGNNQNDAHEFLYILLDEINEELHKKNKNSIIEELFKGNMKSMIKCNCDNITEKDEDYNILTVFIIIISYQYQI